MFGAPEPSGPDTTERIGREVYMAGTPVRPDERALAPRCMGFRLGPPHFHAMFHSTTCRLCLCGA